jgi:hypothetical protein
MIGAILAGLARYKLAAELIVFGSLAVGIVWGAHEFLEHERQLGRTEVLAQWDAQIAKDKATAAAQTADWQTRLAAATNEGAKREETIRSLAASAVAATGGLRDAIGKVNSTMPDYSADALRALTSTYGQLLAECAGRRQEVGEEAERLNSEKRTLIEAYPKSAPAAGQ